MRISSEFLRYCIVGILNTIAGISTAYVILNVFSQPYIVATIGAYIVGVSVSFLLNKVFTFKNCDETNCVLLFAKFVVTMLPSYAVSYFSGWLFSKSITLIPYCHNAILKFSNLFGIEEHRVLDNFAILVSMIIYLLLGFFVNKYFVFKKK